MLASVSRYCFCESCPARSGNIPRLNEASLDFRVLLFAIVASLLTSVFTGVFPAIGGSRATHGFAEGARNAGQAAGHSRVQSALIVMQTAMVVVLLAGAGLLIRSYINVVSVDTGFSRSAVTSISVWTTGISRSRPPSSRTSSPESAPSRAYRQPER